MLFTQRRFSYSQSQSVSQPASHPARQAVSQSVSHLVSQSVSHSVSHSVCEIRLIFLSNKINSFKIFVEFTIWHGLNFKREQFCLIVWIKDHINWSISALVIMILKINLYKVVHVSLVNQRGFYFII